MHLQTRTKARGAHYRAGLLAALLASLTVQESAFSGMAWAQPAETQGTRQFDIPAQALTEALVQFGYQSGLQVAADGTVAASVRSTAVSGLHTPSEALSRVLAGTGLTFRFTGANTVQVQKLANSPAGIMQLDPVKVQGHDVPSQAMIDNIPPAYAGGRRNFAAAALNLGGSIEYEARSERLPLTLKAGAAYKLGDRAAVSSDACFPVDEAPYLALGAESEMFTSEKLRFFWRAGFNTGSIGDFGGFNGFSGGIGFLFKSLQPAGQIT